MARMYARRLLLLRAIENGLCSKLDGAGRWSLEDTQLTLDSRWYAVVYCLHYGAWKE